jgi:hypothetical protein
MKSEVVTTPNTPNRPRRGRPEHAQPLAVFEQNLADAERLILLSETLTNERKRHMRPEKREAISNAVRTSKRDRELLDIAENDEVLIVFKPGCRSCREHFEEAELRPLLRQAIVAIAAAVESYVAAKAKHYVPVAYKAKEPPKRLLDIGLTMEGLIDIERRYERRVFGHYALVWNHIDQVASANPDSIGRAFSVVGKTGIWKRVDTRCKKKLGDSERQLRALANRRDLIAHTGDRRGGGKAAINASEVRLHLVNARQIVEALEAVLD